MMTTFERAPRRAAGSLSDVSELSPRAGGMTHDTSFLEEKNGLKEGLPAAVCAFPPFGDFSTLSKIDVRRGRLRIGPARLGAVRLDEARFPL